VANSVPPRSSLKGLPAPESESPLDALHTAQDRAPPSSSRPHEMIQDLDPEQAPSESEPLGHSQIRFARRWIPRRMVVRDGFGAWLLAVPSTCAPGTPKSRGLSQQMRRRHDASAMGSRQRSRHAEPCTNALLCLRRPPSPFYDDRAAVHQRRSGPRSTIGPSHNSEDGCQRPPQFR